LSDSSFDYLSAENRNLDVQNWMQGMVPLSVKLETRPSI